MFTLSKDNIIEYLKDHMPGFDETVPAKVSMVGEGSEEEDGDGYVNHIFRVQMPGKAYVVKQGLPIARVSQMPMDINRNRLEYDSMRIRYSIVPEYTPALMFQDQENNVFVMEDVSCLQIVRFQLNNNVKFENLGRMCGECLAKTDFYTSEYYLDREEYRKLMYRFDNTSMRKIMEDGMFLDMFREPLEDRLGSEFAHFAGQFSRDSRYVTELYKLRRSYMSHADALIHADFHTSNILASDDEMKVIDMEFSFMGPFGYDLGYLTGNLISQYAAACFKPFSTEEDRYSFKAYLLATIKRMYYTYFLTFTSCWNEDCKLRYQDQNGLRRSIFDEIMVDSVGYASMVNWFRSASVIPYPDFDVIEDINARRHAVTLSLLIDWQIMFARYGYRSVDDLIDTILFVEKNYYSLSGRE
ncbi:MAG: phosphotransferase [Eubacterium sp.]|nr:phosphotransferase [Eubacterium sp.]